MGPDDWSMGSASGPGSPPAPTCFPWCISSTGGTPSIPALGSGSTSQAQLPGADCPSPGTAIQWDGSGVHGGTLPLLVVPLTCCVSSHLMRTSGALHTFSINHCFLKWYELPNVPLPFPTFSPGSRPWGPGGLHLPELPVLNLLQPLAPSASPRVPEFLLPIQTSRLQKTSAQC